MKRVFAASALVCLLSGCASIFYGPTQAVTIHSAPEGAVVSVTNASGEKVHTGTTPATLTLKRGAGYFKSEVYTIGLKKEGFADKEITITGTVNGWYIGNILFGGLIGMLAVDPATGAMYSFPDAVTGTLDAAAPASAPAKTSMANPTLTIVSMDSLTPAQKQHAHLLAVAH